MSAPRYVPSDLGQQPREGVMTPPPRGWTATRPADLGAAQPHGATLGHQGPDQGYALTLARRFEDRVVVTEGEHAEDAVAGCLGVATKRASIFGRAPVIHDWTVAFTIWGFLGEAPPELVEHRRPLFDAVSHHYREQRAIAAAVPEVTLRLPHGEVVRRFPSDWRGLLGL